MINEEATIEPEGKKYLGTTVNAALYMKCKIHAASTSRQMNEFIELAVTMLMDYEEGGKRYVPGTTLSVSNSSGSDETKQD